MFIDLAMNLKVLPWSERNLASETCGSAVGKAKGAFFNYVGKTRYIVAGAPVALKLGGNISILWAKSIGLSCT